MEESVSGLNNFIENLKIEEISSMGLNLTKKILQESDLNVYLSYVKLLSLKSENYDKSIQLLN